MAEFVKTARQQELTEMLGGPELWNLAYGGSRSGKTLLLLRAVVIRMEKACGSTHCIIRRTMKDAKQKIGLTSFPQMMRLCFPQLPYDINRSDWYIDIETNGAPSRIWLAGLDDIAERDDRILGHEFSTIYVNEASEVAFDSVTTAMTRLAEKNCLRKKIFLDCNPPRRKHWLYTLFMLGINPKSNLAMEPGSYASMRLNPVDNMENLDPLYMNILDNLPARKRLRFRDGEFADEDEGKMWLREWIDAARITERPELRRIVIAVDPAVSATSTSDDTGICVVGLRQDGQFVVLEDATMAAASPAAWATRVNDLYAEYQADLIVAEVNQGGDLVASNLHNTNPNLPVKVIRATRGKALRAEPVAALYERGRVHHLGEMNELEDELIYFDPARSQRSPGRLDSLVYAVSELAGVEIINPLILTPDDIDEYLAKAGSVPAEPDMIFNEAVWQ